MKIQLKNRSSRGGFAIIVVMVLLVMMGALVVSNNLALRQLKREMDLIEKRQLEQSGAKGGHLIFKDTLVNELNGSFRR